MWADGIYFNIRLEDEANQKQCILVLIGATVDGKKELIAVSDGYREPEQSWSEMLNDVKRRGLKHPPNLAAAERHWRRLNGYQLIPDVIEGIRFIDGIKEIAA